MRVFVRVRVSVHACLTGVGGWVCGCVGGWVCELVKSCFLDTPYGNGNICY